MLQDLVLAAVNEAGRKVDEAIQEKVGGLTGGMKLPGDVASARRVVEDEQVRQPGAAQHQRRVLRVEPHPGVEPRRRGLDRAEVGDLLPARPRRPGTGRSPARRGRGRRASRPSRAQVGYHRFDGWPRSSQRPVCGR